MFGEISIRKKVGLALLGTALFAVLVAVVALLVFENLTLERRVRRFVEPYAQLVSVGAETAVAFRDPDRAEEILNTLRANPQVLEAQIFLESGARLASYNSRTNFVAAPAQPASIGVHIGGTTAESVLPLADGARLRVVVSLDQIRQETRQYLWLLFCGMCVLLAISAGLMAVLQRTVVNPISALVEATERVRTRSDYERRVPASGNDEIARLGRSFNAMMEAVQQRDHSLREISLLQRTILDNAAYGIVSTRSDGVITSFNQAAEQLLGYTAAEVVGIATPMLWHDREEIAQCARELAKETGEMIEPGFGVFVARFRRKHPDEGEWTFIRKDGSRVPVALSGTVLRSETGEISGYVGLAYDLTERKRAEQALRRMNEELEQRVNERTTALRVKSDELQESQRALMNIIEDINEKTSALEAVNKEIESFSYSVSHDLRAPLRSIDGFSRALLEDYSEKLDDEGKQNLMTIRAASQRMGQLIDDMLRLSKLNRGEMRWTTVNLSELTEQIGAELKHAEPQRAVEFVIAPDCVVSGDASLLRIAMENILSNAWKYTSKKSRATIEFGSTMEAKGRVFFVRDNGCGFDMKYVNKLFGAFQRLHTAQEFPGTGVGLASVQRVMRRHGGKVWIEGQVGQGTTLYFTLPTESQTL
jgi:PAS domain S-box-containing protein